MESEYLHLYQANLSPRVKPHCQRIKLHVSEFKNSVTTGQISRKNSSIMRRFLLLWFKWELEGEQETRMDAKVMEKGGYV